MALILNLMNCIKKSVRFSDALFGSYGKRGIAISEILFIGHQQAIKTNVRTVFSARAP